LNKIGLPQITGPTFNWLPLDQSEAAYKDLPTTTPVGVSASNEMVSDLEAGDPEQQEGGQEGVEEHKVQCVAGQGAGVALVDDLAPLGDQTRARDHAGVTWDGTPHQQTVPSLEESTLMMMMMTMGDQAGFISALNILPIFLLRLIHCQCL